MVSKLKFQGQNHVLNNPKSSIRNILHEHQKSFLIKVKTFEIINLLTIRIAAEVTPRTFFGLFIHDFVLEILIFSLYLVTCQGQAGLGLSEEGRYKVNIMQNLFSRVNPYSMKQLSVVKATGNMATLLGAWAIHIFVIDLYNLYKLSFLEYITYL